jgi:2-polyprenyl-3-methyl-5-hydroxy-6-metoxy-1,4-benzoquinol methylase
MISQRNQAQHFDRKDNQYSIEALVNPPIHTQMEIERIVKAVKENKKNNRIADFGAGTGRLTIPLVKAGFNVEAIDISQESLKTLKKITNQLNYRVETAPVLNKSKKYDVIAGCDILHHLDIKNELPSINKRLEREGLAIFSEPGAWNPVWYLYIFAILDWNIEKGILQCTHHNLKSQLRNAGFSNFEIIGLGLFPRSLMKGKFLCQFNDWLGNLPVLKLFAYRYIIKAIKT